LIADMSVAPEIAMLAEPRRPAEPLAFVPAQPAAPPALVPLTLGTLAGRLRSIAATPERWWGLVRFDPDRSVKIMIEESASHQAWLVVLPPGDAGHGCDCDVVTMIAGEAAEGTPTSAEGTPTSAVLRPGPVRVHGQKQEHGLHGRGAGYSISLHARTHPRS
jgi:hypothetical protein